MSFSTYQRLKTWLRSDTSLTDAGRRRERDHGDRPCRMQELEPRMLLSAVLTGAIPDHHIQASGGTAVIDLTNYFDDDEITGTVVRYDTVYGDFDLELFDDDTPITVDNFLGYVDRGDYDGTFIHRNALNGDNSPFVVQGGGFKFTAPNKYNAVTQGPSITNEFGISNTRGTIAMAKIDGNPDSATNQWFFNMADNGGTAPNGLDFQNGGFTVFGQVLGDGMDIVDQIAATPNWNASSINGAFGSLPLRDFTNDHFPNNNDLVVINSIKRVEKLTYSVVANSQQTRVAAIVDADGILKIFTIGTSLPETVTITVQAQGYNGDPVQTTITLEIGAAKDSLDGDRTPDLIWRNFNNGKNTVWEMSGFDIQDTTALDRVNSTTWYIAGVGDFNNDGSNDLLWRNAYDGQNKVWLMDGTNLISTVDLRTVPGRAWSVGGVADFDNDGDADILWRKANKGVNVVWTMDGTVEDGSMRLAKQNGTDWVIGGVGDFDRDGATDILWHNEAGGQNKVWLQNHFDGTTRQSVALLTQPGTNWVVAGVGDYSQGIDNQMDILWRNVKTGKQMVWVMNGTTRTAVRNDIRALRKQYWQLPGRTSQLVADANAIAKIQRLNKNAKAASAIAASAQAAQASVSLLSEVEPIIDLNLDDPTLDI